MTARKPWRNWEPDCVHSHDYGSSVRMPASACLTCKDGAEYREWSASWAAWLAENPDSPEAKFVAEVDRRGWLHFDSKAVRPQDNQEPELSGLAGTSRTASTAQVAAASLSSSSSFGVERVQELSEQNPAALDPRDYVDHEWLGETWVEGDD